MPNRYGIVGGDKTSSQNILAVIFFHCFTAFSITDLLWLFKVTYNL